MAKTLMIGGISKISDSYRLISKIRFTIPVYDIRGSMQMSMRKLNSHTILQNYPLWCCCHVMYKLLCPSTMVRTAPPVSFMVRVRVSVSVSFTV